MHAFQNMSHCVNSGKYLLSLLFLLFPPFYTVSTVSTVSPVSTDSTMSTVSTVSTVSTTFLMVRLLHPARSCVRNFAKQPILNDLILDETAFGKIAKDC